ncbi:MAG TPA: hypothetical protein VIF10_00765 [Methylobacter sp.]|jgi:hypothetical protein
MKLRTLSTFFIFILLISPTTFAATSIPKPLAEKIQNLVTVLSAGYAVGYPKATMIQTIKGGGNTDVTLAVFTIEGFDGGNNYSQYLVAFSPETMEDGKQPFRLIDVMRIGGGAWRVIQKLNAKSSPELKSDEATIAIEALENTDYYSPNFASKKSTITLVLKNGRFYEK